MSVLIFFGSKRRPFLVKRCGFKVQKPTSEPQRSGSDIQACQFLVIACICDVKASMFSIRE